jgi:hypothetical protein
MNDSDYASPGRRAAIPTYAYQALLCGFLP